MYRVALKTAVVEALRATFDEQYPEADFRNIHIDIEYPMLPQDYPGMWVNYQDDAQVQRSGIGHVEYLQDDDGIWHAVGRWKFSGHVSLTIAAMSSMERDRLFDQVVRILMTSDVDSTLAGRFKRSVENNDKIGFIFNFDELTVTGEGASPGTPWGSEDIFYETTIEIDCIGEFISDPKNNALVSLSKILVEGFVQDDPNQSFDVSVDQTVEWTPDQWT
jgi:hypothetical protein